ncbi:MAG: S8 family serine peptidase [Crocinitomicaceae bacterium]|nr:S8 family serine peptidase [Crocinitomicaceae bacterium]
MDKLLRTLLIIPVLFATLYAGAQKIGFDNVLRESPDRLTTFCVPNNTQNRDLLENEGISVKYVAGEWAFITATPSWIKEKMDEKSLTDFYFELAPPALMADTARAFHFVDDVHAGNGGLGSGYTGAGVIIGYVDTGIDFNHDDFKEADGTTRVLRYWDQSMPDNASSPPPYNYGFVWDSSAINNQTCTSMDNSGHGSTVAGQGSGNGLANGRNMGMAPDSKIIMVESDFSRPNWTMTVADACDFIFKTADSLGMPAVVNLSLGTYLGSHDGNDPASVAIEAMLDSQPGRIVICAAGNSGNQTGYHIYDAPDADTNFTWLRTNPSGVLGSSAILFDLWTDIGNDTWNYSFAVDRPNPDWTQAGETIYRTANGSIGTTIYDTIRNQNQDIMCTIETATEIVYGAYHMQVIMTNCDSLGTPYPYLYRFNTTGSGDFDLWSGKFIGWNEIVFQVMTPAQYPEIVYYLMPDTNQCIVSSWNCSPKVISVGNMRNRLGHIDFNMNQYYPSEMTTPGYLALNSSHGPNRVGLTKPDITAAGDISMGAAPLWLSSNPANNGSLDEGGEHVRNGGTSMSSPVVAGIAALYLERCGQATYQDFIDDMISSAYTDAATGAVPNNLYGYGKIHALDLLLSTNLPSVPTITDDWNGTLTSSTANSYQWFYNDTLLNGEINQDLNIIVPPYGTYIVEVANAEGCTATSAPMTITLSIEEGSQNLIATYPNPTNSSITITSEFQITDVQLVSMDGSSVTLESEGSNSYSLDDVPSGSYLLHVYTENGLYYSKVIRL